jgi:hypothetical protein
METRQLSILKWETEKWKIAPLSSEVKLFKKHIFASKIFKGGGVI